MKNKRIIGFIAGIAVAVIVSQLPLKGLSWGGLMTLALTLMTVVFWAFNVMQSGYVGGLFCGLVILLGIVKPSIVFSTWIKPTIWMMMAAFLIAAAVKNSGLANRISYTITLRFVKGWKSIVFIILVLQILLGLCIPNVFARCFLIFAVVKAIIDSSNINKRDSVILGFSIFALANPTQMIFLTGETTINMLSLSSAGLTLGWFEWFLSVGVPSIFSSFITFGLILLLFKPTDEINIDKEAIRTKQAKLGALTAIEKRMVVWLVILTTFWMTDSLHGLNISYGTMLLTMLMAAPKIGDLITSNTWSEIPVNILFFVTSALAIGTVGGATGMNTWIAKSLMPNSISSNLFVLAAFITAVTVVLHMLLGSQLTVTAVTVPIMLTFTAGMNISPVVITMWVYQATVLHYFLPFHCLPMAVGFEPAGYTNAECIRIGMPLTALVFIVNVLICIPWWKLINLL